MAARKPAPAPLNVVEDFVNTLELDYDVRVEQLDTPAKLGGWLSEKGLIEADAVLTDEDCLSAQGVREDLRALLLANNGGDHEAGAAERLNRVAQGAPVTVSFSDDGAARLAPATGGISGALGRILAIVFEAMANGTWPRLKACRNEECTWVFYDSSKNHSAAWCSMRSCGNRMKARAYRRRHSQEHV